MGWSKRQIIEAAFEEIGLAAYTFDLQPQQLDSALRRLDSMMAAWNAKGIRLGYPIPVNAQDSSLNEQTEVPDSAYDAVILNLALRLAPSYGKTPMPETRIGAKQTFDVLLARAAMPPEMQYDASLPMGAGHKPDSMDEPFVSPPLEYVSVGSDSHLELN